MKTNLLISSPENGSPIFIVAEQKFIISKTMIFKKTWTIFAILTCFFCPTLFSQVIEGPINNPDNAHSYYLLKASTWTDAEDSAVKLGGHLVTINNSEEEDFVFNTFGAGSDGSGTDRPLWIGYNDVSTEGTFVWVSGEIVDPLYTHWAGTEPNNYGCGEDYGEIYPNYILGYGGLWTDNDNTGTGGCAGSTVIGYGVVEINCPYPTITPSGSLTFCNGSSVILQANEGTGISYQWKKGAVNIAGATDKTYKAKHSNNFTVVETTSECTVTSEVTTVTAYPNPSATITALGDLDICLLGSVALQANAGIDYTYQWKKGSASIGGATNEEYTAVSKGTYKVVVTNSFGCSKISAGTKVVKSCFTKTDELTAGTDEFISESNLMIYPNPVSSTATISFKLENSKEVSIILFDASGRKVTSVFDGALEAGNQKIEMKRNNLVSGIYLLQIITGTEVQRLKMIIE